MERIQKSIIFSSTTTQNYIYFRMDNEVISAILASEGKKNITVPNVTDKFSIIS